MLLFELGWCENVLDYKTKGGVRMIGRVVQGGDISLSRLDPKSTNIIT